MTLFYNVSLLEPLRLLLSLILNGGWVVLVLVAIYTLYYLYRREIEHQFVHSQKWFFWEIKAPKENLVSTLAVESVFAQMHALHQALTFAEQYVEGRIQLWLSLEIVSLGGKISYIIRGPESFKDLISSSFYSHYPTMEITEISDYLENLSYDPETSDFELWGVEYRPVEDDVIPIKTYRDFEHPTAEEKIIDPLNNLIEALAGMSPHEFMGVQLIIQPLADDEWKPRGDKLVKELIGEEVPHEAKFSDLLMAPLNWVASFSFKDIILGGGHGHEHEEKKDRNNWMSMTDEEKARVNAIQRKISKPGYKCKIRSMYIAPKDKVVKGKRYMVVGFFRTLGSLMTNKLKPFGLTWTSVPYQISPTLEAPYMQWETNRRKKNMFIGYKNRDIHIGATMFVMNTEEIATLFHFPITTTPTSGAVVSKVASTKSQPPVDLPIGEP